MARVTEELPLRLENREALLGEAAECTFVWSTADGWPVEVTMAYLWERGCFWFVTGADRPRVAAVRRDPRVSVVVRGCLHLHGGTAGGWRNRTFLRWYYSLGTEKRRSVNSRGERAHRSTREGLRCAASHRRAEESYSMGGHAEEIPMQKLRPSRHPIATAAVAVTVVVALSFHVAPALAQDSEETLGEGVAQESAFAGETGYAFQGKSDIDGGGSMQVNRFDAGVVGRVQLMEPLRWTNSFLFGVNDYDFDGGGFAAGNPWETILSMRLTSTLRYALNDEWGVSAGGVFMLSPETGANWGDSFNGGGLVGVDYRPNKSLFISLGAAVISQIEDDVAVAPSVVVNWVPAERWAVRVGSVPVTGGAAAAGEVAYRVADPVEIGLGLLFQERRFRLDDSGPAPKGVGEDSVMPLRLRVGWHITQQISLHAFCGVALAGQVQLDDRSGSKLNRQDYDPAPYAGIRFVGRL